MKTKAMGKPPKVKVKSPTRIMFAGIVKAFYNSEKKNEQLADALTEAIDLLIQWHDPGTDKKAYRFDLTDHPKVRRLYAVLDRAKVRK